MPIDPEVTIITDLRPGVPQGAFEAAEILRIDAVGFIPTHLPAAVGFKPHPTYSEANHASSAIAIYVGWPNPVEDADDPSHWVRFCAAARKHKQVISIQVNPTELDIDDVEQRIDTLTALRRLLPRSIDWPTNPTIYITGPSFRSNAQAEIAHDNTREWLVWLLQRLLDTDLKDDYKAPAKVASANPEIITLR